MATPDSVDPEPTDGPQGPGSPKEPPLPEPDTLEGRVRAALYALPDHFTSSLTIEGVRATDLHTFNTSLGASIEDQLVESLNALRSIWDEDDEYPLYRFVRQPQTFPDVVLKNSDPKPGSDAEPILMGIELKGWYALAKEREPSFRYLATPAVCAPADLLVVYPWALSRAVSGTPRVFPPYVVSARYAAEARNYHWENRDSAADKTVNLSSVTSAYPTKSDEISDRPASDSGGNFGRYARTNLMNPFIAELWQRDLVGISLDYWQKFLRIFGENSSAEQIDHALETISKSVKGKGAKATKEQLAKLRQQIIELNASIEALGSDLLD